MKGNNRSIDTNIRRIWLHSNKRYGAPRIAMELAKGGIQASRPRVQRRMKALNIRCCYPRKYRTTTDSRHHLPVSDHVLKRQFYPKALSRVWVSDITYVRHRSGWSYLTTMMDLADRQIIGWSLAQNLTSEATVIPAFHMALTKRSPQKEMIFHSDRGSQYASQDFRTLLAQYGICQSMSRKGNCWDNAVAESFFKTLKTELPDGYQKSTHDELRLLIFEYIEIWYNRKRIHSSIDYKTPFEMESFLKQVA